MKLNDGRYEVEINDATVLAIGPWQTRHNGYSYETEQRYTLYRTKGGTYFSVMEYTEHITILAKLLGKERLVHGHSLHVYGSKREALSWWGGVNGLDVPASELEPLP